MEFFNLGSGWLFVFWCGGVSHVCREPITMLPKPGGSKKGGHGVPICKNPLFKNRGQFYKIYFYLCNYLNK